MPQCARATVVREESQVGQVSRGPDRSAGTTRWLKVEDLDYYVEQYRKGGFRGPLNWYWNIDCDNELTPQLEKAKIEQPAFFITGKKNLVMSFPGE